jgi:hemin uptake protein HemP
MNSTMSENSDKDPSSEQEHVDLGEDLKNQLPKIISFDTLARCGDEIWIENNNQIYRLRRTKQGKLILTK